MVTKKYNKVCSVHFIDREPSKNNPYPTKRLGYESSSKIKNVAVKIRSLEYRRENSQKTPLSYLWKNMRVPRK